MRRLTLRQIRSPIPLAIEGGPPVRSAPLATNTVVTADDVAAATSVLESGHLGGTDHPAVRAFEVALASSAGVAHARAVSSGTAAIHSILLALGVGDGDEVIVPAHTFVASATPALMARATPVVVDVDDETYCIDPAAVDRYRTERTKAVVAVHVNGHPAPVDHLPSDLAVISDACQAHGATLSGRPVAGLGTAGAFSFWENKLVTTGGEGGAVVTDDAGLAGAVDLIRSHAMAPNPDTGNFEHVSLGFNYRLTAVQAAIGLSQLSRLPDVLSRRRAQAERLASLLAGLPELTLPVTRRDAVHAYWKFVVRFDPEQLAADRGRLIAALVAEGIPAAPRYPVPLNRQPVLLAAGPQPACPTAERLAGELVTLPLSTGPDAEHDTEDVAEAVHKVVAAHRR